MGKYTLTPKNIEEIAKRVCREIGGELYYSKREFEGGRIVEGYACVVGEEEILTTKITTKPYEKNEVRIIGFEKETIIEIPYEYHFSYSSFAISPERYYDVIGKEIKYTDVADKVWGIVISRFYGGDREALLINPIDKETLKKIEKSLAEHKLLRIDIW